VWPVFAVGVKVSRTARAGAYCAVARRSWRVQGEGMLTGRAGASVGRRYFEDMRRSVQVRPWPVTATSLWRSMVFGVANTVVCGT
jgi:hypothetical protein